jgi:FkbM family methyltransferase
MTCTHILASMGIKSLLPGSTKVFLVTQALKVGGFLRPLGMRRARRHGVVVDLRSPLVNNHCVAALFWGIYEWGERRAIQRWLLKDVPVVELGASIGFISSLAARTTTAGAHVAVEANPNLLPLLRQNLQLNDQQDKVRVVWGAIDYSGAAEVSLDLGNGSNLGGAVASGGNTSSDVTVPTTTLNDLLKEHGLRKFTLISDIEGAEIGLLDESPDAISACEQMIIELHPTTDRQGKKLTLDELGHAIADRWKLRVVHRDGAVWVMQR